MANVVVSDASSAIILLIAEIGKGLLFEIIETYYPLALLFGPRQGRQEQGGENGDDRDDDQQLDQGEGALPDKTIARNEWPLGHRPPNQTFPMPFHLMLRNQSPPPVTRWRRPLLLIFLLRTRPLSWLRARGQPEEHIAGASGSYGDRVIRSADGYGGHGCPRKRA